MNDYRPDTLTSVVMKSFEPLCFNTLYYLYFTDLLLDPLQLADRANRSVDDSVNMALHYILQHQDSAENYARILFVDFSSTFNTILPPLTSQALLAERTQLHLKVDQTSCLTGGNM